MIRSALPNDALQLARLVILAMGDLSNKFVANTADTIALFEHFARIEANQYSYENMLVWDDYGIRGMISGYDGAKLAALRKPFLEHIREAYGLDIKPEDETQAGEYYIDCLAVFPEYQGKGIGKKLITGLAQLASANRFGKLGLIVKQGNVSAEKFYYELGFKAVDVRIFMGDTYEHLQLSCTNL